MEIIKSPGPLSCGSNLFGCDYGDRHEDVLDPVFLGGLHAGLPEQLDAICVSSSHEQGTPWRQQGCEAWWVLDRVCALDTVRSSFRSSSRLFDCSENMANSRNFDQIWGIMGNAMGNLRCDGNWRGLRVVADRRPDCVPQGRTVAPSDQILHRLIRTSMLILQNPTTTC